MITYCINGDYLRAYNPETKTLFNITDKSFLLTQNHFFVSGNYQGNDEDLIRYTNDLITSNDELKAFVKSIGKKQNFDYINEFKTIDNKIIYKTHNYSILRFFKLLQKEIPMDTINRTEAFWYKKTHNGGLYYSVKGVFQSFGYDKKNFYASLLPDKEFKFPIKQGKEIFLDKLPDNMKTLDYGLYNVVVVCNDANFKKVFSISKNNVYTHYCLIFLTRLKEKYNFNITLTLNIQVEKNALVYDKDNLVAGKYIFGDWYKNIALFKQMYPKNVLGKLLSSSLWGQLSKSNNKYILKKEADENKLYYGVKDDVDYYLKERLYNDDNSEYFKLQDMNAPYKYNYRLKPFLTSFGRKNTAVIALKDIDNVIRIHTDGICFKKQIEFQVENFVPEMKRTGLIKFPI
jgi:hypothetical protein